MIPGDYSNLFFSGLRVMAHTRRRVPSTPSAPSASSSILSSTPSSPDTDSTSTSFRVRALKSLFQSMRRAPSKAPTRGRGASAGAGATGPSTQEKKAARRRTLPAASAAPADVFSVWIVEKSPLAQASPAAALHTHIEEEDPRPKTGALDPSSPSRSFVITLTEQHPSIPAPTPAKDDDFLSFSTSSPRRRRARPVSLPVPIRLPSHPYRMSEHEREREDSDSTDSADAISCELASADDWRQFHVEWIGRETAPLA